MDIIGESFIQRTVKAARTVKFSNSRGASLVEYSLLIALVVLGSLALMSQLGSNVSCSFTMVRMNIAARTGSGRLCASEYQRCIVPTCSFGSTGPSPCDLDGNGTYDVGDGALIGNAFDGSC